MKMLFTISFTFAAAVLHAQAPVEKTAEEWDVREATYRYQFTDNASALGQRGGAYFLSVVVKNKEHTDPPADFMKRFANNKPPVKAFSECVWPTKKGVLDKKTGERGLVFYIAAIKWVSDTEVEVTGGYVEGNLSASGNTYHLKKADGKWKVVKNAKNWIS